MEIYILKDIEKIENPYNAFPANAERHHNFERDKQAILSQAKKVDMFHVKIEQIAEGNNPPYLKDDMGRGLLLWSSWGQALNMGKCKDGYLAFIPSEFLQSKLKED
jgi:hypothetical protein